MKHSNEKYPITTEGTAYRRRYHAWAGVLAAFLLAGGCSSFDHEWARADKMPAPSPGVIGRWKGKWQSQANGHDGSLRCIIARTEGGGYKARFRAVYRKVVGFGYTVPLTICETNGAFGFSGKANLGWWAGGVYQYEGQIEGTNFLSTYQSKYDHGTFQMTRYPPEGVEKP